VSSPHLNLSSEVRDNAVCTVTVNGKNACELVSEETSSGVSIDQKNYTSMDQKNYTPMESTYYNFTTHKSFPEIVGENFDAANAFTRHYQRDHKSLSHLPSNDSNVKIVRSNSSVTEIKVTSDLYRDTSPDHLGIPVARATLVPNYRVSHNIPGDTSDDSSTSTVSPPRYSRRTNRVTINTNSPRNN